MSNMTFTDGRSLSGSARTALFLFLLCLPVRLSAQVIDFESLPVPGNGTGGLVVRNRFAASGLVVNSPTALDFSQGIAIPGFAHSGTKAIELCYGIEFCSGPLELTFTTAPRRVKLWGLAGARLPIRKAVDYNIQIARGLAAAQEKGIVHWDLKPENVFVTRDGRAQDPRLRSGEAHAYELLRPPAAATR